MKELKKYRVLLTWLATLALVAVWYLGIYGGELSRQDDLNGKYLSALETRDKLRDRLDLAPQITTSLRRAEKDWSLLTKEFIAPDSAYKIKQFIGKIAGEHDLTVLNMDLDFATMLGKVCDGEHLSYVERVGIKLECRGRFFDVGNFVEALERESLVAAVHRSRLTYQAAADPEIYLDLSLDVFIQSGEGKLL